MRYRIGKNFELVRPEVIDQYSEVQLEVLWYLLDLTKVHRFISEESFREFVTRYLLISNSSLDQTAINFIDHGTLIDGYLKDEYFSLTVKDFIKLIGFASSERKYNIYNTLDGYIRDYSFLSPKASISYNRNDSGESEIQSPFIKDTSINLSALFLIDNLTVDFKDDLKTLTNEDLTRTVNFANFVTNNIDKKYFGDFNQSFPEAAEEFEERYFPEKVISLNVYTDIERSNLIEIYKIILHKETLNQFLEQGTSDQDFCADLKIPNEHIKFAWGVKQEYIKLSTDPNSFRYCYDPYFYLDLDLIHSDEGICYPTQEVYDTWNMAKWLHLVS